MRGEIFPRIADILEQNTSDTDGKSGILKSINESGLRVVPQGIS